MGDDAPAARETSRVFRTFRAYLFSRNIRFEEDLVHQLFNRSEKHLARLLLLLARFGKEGKPETLIPKISQETLAQMVARLAPGSEKAPGVLRLTQAGYELYRKKSAGE